MRTFRLNFYSFLLIIFTPQYLLADDLRQLCQEQPKYHIEHLRGNSHTYTVKMGGAVDGEMTRDPVGYWAYDQYWEPNLYVRMENTGNKPVVNPWIFYKKNI